MRRSTFALRTEGVLYCVVTATGSADALNLAVTAPVGVSRSTTHSPSRMSGVLAVAE
jgi:hypothetical protein